MKNLNKKILVKIFALTFLFTMFAGSNQETEAAIWGPLVRCVWGLCRPLIGTGAVCAVGAGAYVAIERLTQNDPCSTWSDRCQAMADSRSSPACNQNADPSTLPNWDDAYCTCMANAPARCGQLADDLTGGHCSGSGGNPANP